MPVVTVELNARQDTAGQPIIWRLGRLFTVVTNIRRARVTEDYGYVSLDIEGSTAEVEQAVGYLRALGVTSGEAPAATRLPAPPENAISPDASISVQLQTVNAAQSHAPILYRLGKDFDVVVNITHAAFDSEDGGTLDILLAGPLIEAQRAIAYLHTTGIHVFPRQRSVTDYGNL